MQWVRPYAGLAAGALLLIAAIPYFRSILSGATKPNPVSWGIWAAIGFLLLLSYRASGATETIWLAVGYFLVPFVVFFLSLRNAVGCFSAFDAICLGSAGFGVAVWLLFKSAPLAVCIYVAIDAFGAAPTLRKAYLEPLSENLEAWLLGFAASAINLLAISDWSPRISLYPLYACVCTGSIAAVLLARRRVLASRPETAI